MKKYLIITQGELSILERALKVTPTEMLVNDFETFDSLYLQKEHLLGIHNEIKDVLDLKTLILIENRGGMMHIMGYIMQGFQYGHFFSTLRLADTFHKRYDQDTAIGNLKPYMEIKPKNSNFKLLEGHELNYLGDKAHIQWQDGTLADDIVYMGVIHEEPIEEELPKLKEEGIEWGDLTGRIFHFKICDQEDNIIFPALLQGFNYLDNGNLHLDFELLRFHGPDNPNKQPLAFEFDNEGITEEYIWRETLEEDTLRETSYVYRRFADMLLIRAQEEEYRNGAPALLLSSDNEDNNLPITLYLIEEEN